MAVRVMDLFCGAGGSSSGARMAGADIVAAVDVWAIAAETYAANFAGATVYRSMAQKVDPAQVIRDVGGIDLLLASPECQSHSIARGSLQRSESSRDTALEVIRFAEGLQPRWVVVENVPQMKHWHKYDDFLRQLTSLGYALHVAILDSQFFGTPQSRRRLIVVGDNAAKPVMPTPMDVSGCAADIIGRDEPEGAPWQYRPVDAPRRSAATLGKVERARVALQDPLDFLLLYYSRGKAYRSLDQPLPTVVSSDRLAYVRRGQAGYEMRMLQPTELAAAMGFPEDHQWPAGSRRDRVRMIGNAVCPPLMRDIVRSLTGSHFPATKETA